MRLSVKIFLEEEDKYLIGPGRLELLRAVRDSGSLRKAAQRLGMSYRWAWGRLNKAERELGRPLLVRTNEPLGGRPKILTPEALELLEWFTDVERRMRQCLDSIGEGMPSFLQEPREKGASQDPPKKHKGNTPRSAS